MNGKGVPTGPLFRSSVEAVQFELPERSGSGCSSRARHQPGETTRSECNERAAPLRGEPPKAANNPSLSSGVHPLIRFFLSFFSFFIALSASTSALAQAASSGASIDPVHWAYAAYYGTGRYALSGDSDTYVLGVTPGRTFREPVLHEDGQRTLGIRLRVPVAIGSHHFSTDVAINQIALDDVNTISIVPGVEIEIPMTERWTLKTLTYVGYGSEPGHDNAADVYWVGMRSRYAFEPGKTRISLVNGITRMGYSGDSGESSQAMPLLSGLDFRRQLQKKLGDERVFLNWHVSYTRYIEDLGVDLPGLTENSINISSEWELGLAFSKGDSRLSLWRLSWDRLGLAYRFDSSGSFSGVSIYFASLFDR
jgi:hypothetical protein